MLATRELADEFREKNKRQPNDAEIAQLISIAAEETEKHFVSEANKWADVLRALGLVAAPAEEAPARRTPTTIGSSFGAGQTAPVDKSKLTKRERHELIRARLRQANREAPVN